MSDNLYFIETMTAALAQRLLDEHQAGDVETALDTVYNSAIYEKISDERTRLMYQHPGYVYTFLRDEVVHSR